MRRLQPLLLFLVVAAGASVPAAAAPAVDGGAASVRANLGETQKRIRALQDDIAATQGAYSEATKALQESERAVSEARRRLAEVARDLKRARRQVDESRAEGAAVRNRIAARREELATWLHTHYVQGRSSGIAQLLGGTADIESMARRVYYLEQVGRARFQLIESLRHELTRNEVVAAEQAQREAELARLESQQQQQQAELETLAQVRKAAAEKLSAQLASQKQEEAGLKQDEARLARLLEGLARLAREQQLREQQLREQQQREQQQKEQQQRELREQQHRVAEGEKPPPPVQVQQLAVRAPREPVAVPADVAFDSLRGRLPVPVRGSITTRFGATRSGGGTSSKGIFIRAVPGAEVHAVAPGAVVFSDWMRGFGNLIIVDHGDQYMTIYGNNDVLLKTTGDTVTAGEVIANVGASNGGEDSGLYFEIRHRADPQDPQKWLGGGG